MSTRTAITLTDEYQLIASNVAIITIVDAPVSVKMYLNNANNDTAADIFYPSTKSLEKQIRLTTSQNYYAKGAGIKIIVEQV